MTTHHTPVLLQETLSYLSPSEGRQYLDATLGYGGHTLALLEAGAKVIGLDQDKSMLDLATERVQTAGHGSRLTPVYTSFTSYLQGETLKALKANSLDGVLFDLGVSSLQLDTPERGFSFRFDAPLDMRMDRDRQQVTARDLVNGLGVNELVELLTKLAEEPRSTKLAHKIVEARKQSPITTTAQLATIIESVIPRTGHLHPATKVFQALRMAVNSEREELQAALPSAWSLLKDGGVLVVISFHSLEDRLVKEFMQSISGEELTKKPRTATSTELASNPRARSAKLRAKRKVVK